MPVTLRRHVKTTKVNGKKIIRYAAVKAGILAGKKLRAEYPNAEHITSRASPIERAMVGAKTATRAFGIKKPKVRGRSMLNLGVVITNEPRLMEICENRYANNEVLMRNAWLKGETFEGTILPVKQVSETIIRRHLGLGLAGEAGKAGFGRKGVPLRKLIVDNTTHSWIVESVVERLTRGVQGAPKMENLVKETEGIGIRFDKQPTGRFKVKLTYEEAKDLDVTKNFAECMLPSVKKYLEV